jgi:succinate-semialdehyde dehydrogenase/glutarate-semialdehyde dehydrogenase
MVAEAETFARLIVRENGKALRDARSEVAYAAEFFRWFAEEAVRVPGDMRRSPNGQNWIMVTEEPIGVALLVTPWNYPAAMATRKIAPALAAGCTAVLKPAAETPLTALALADLLERAGLPRGVLNVVCTRRSGPLVDHALHDPRVRALSFTGSTEVGRVLLAAAADNVVRASMELGGNAPFVVLDDADLEEAVEGLMVAKLRNGGSACTAANRIYVADAIADDFVAELSARMDAVRCGNGLDEDVELGPLVNAATRDKVADLVEEAVAAGASVTAGGDAGGLPGYHYRATVLADVKPDAEILRTEIFGPVAPVVRFSSTQEAIALANDSEFGLIAYLFTRDLDRGLSVSRRLRAGMVGLNRGVVSDPAAPFGGVKQSGIGREGAAEGIREFLDMKYTAIPYH